VISAIVPAKALDQAKGRLAAILSEDERRELALAMLEDVVRALHDAPSIDDLRVVSPDDEVLTLAADLGAIAAKEPPNIRGINQALDYTFGQIEPPPEVLVVVLADVPLLEPNHIENAVAALPDGRGVVICPSEDKGTSLLAIRPPGVIPFRFGPRSSVLHRREAAALKVPCEVLPLPKLLRDIDTPDDLRALAAEGGDGATHRLLERLRILERA